LIKNHYFLLRTSNPEIETFLKEKKLSYFIVNKEGFTLNKEIKTDIRVIKEEIVKEIKNRSIIYDKIIRSGEEINCKDNLIFLNRINAGARIVTSGNVEIFDECEGNVVCDGEYMIVKKNIRGTIIFKGENIGVIEKLTIITKDYKKVLE